MDEINNIQQSSPAPQPAFPNTASVPPTNVPNTPSGGSNKIVPVIILITLVILLAIAVFYYLSLSKSSSSQKSSTPLSPTQAVTQLTPYETLQVALNKTIAAKTLYLEYKTKVTSSISNAKTGVTQTLHNSVDGNLSGSTDGKTSDLEMKIYADDTPDRSVNVSVMTTESGDLYIRNAQTAPKWQKLTKAENDQMSSGPTDASLYGLNILGTIFSTNQALFKSFTKESVKSLGDEQGDNTTYSKYQVEVSTPSYIEALSKDKDAKQKEIDETKQILQDTIITVTFSIDKNTGYVTKIHIDGKKFTQIPTPESQQLGISTTHDILLDATLSRFNVPTNITAPVTTDVLGASTGPITKPSLLK